MPSAHPGAPSASSVQPDGQASTFDLRPDAVHGLEAEVGSQPVSQLGCDTQSARDTPGGTTLAASRVTRPSRFVVVPPFRVPGRRQHEVRVHRRRVEDGLDRHEEVDTLERPLARS